MKKTMNGFPEEPNNDYYNWEKTSNTWKNPYSPKPYVGDPYPHKHPIDDWKAQKPKPVTVSDLFPRIDRWGIGWSPLLEQLKQISNEKPSYPPYDLIKQSDTQNILDVAVAGFSKSELSITVEDSILVISGKKDTERGGEVLHKGIASRDFELKLALAEYWEVMSAHVNDGLLTIILGKVVPEEKKPKVIDIN